MARRARLRIAAAIACAAAWALACPLALAADAGRKIETGPPPVWVDLHAPDLSPVPGAAAPSAGARLLLLDVQENRRRHERYVAKAVELVNFKGVESFSDLALDYQPAYQSLLIHRLRLRREGRWLDKLSDHEIRSYQREQGLEAGIYDGVATAVVNLRDVRPGDVLEYAYTVSGVNPLLADLLSISFDQQSSIPMRECRLRVIVDPGADVHVHLLRGAEPPRLLEGPHGREYVWSGRDLQPLAQDPSPPLWFDPAPTVVLSTLAGWDEVAAWAEPLYRLSPADLAELHALADTILQGRDRDARVRSAIDFVQDEVRYLAREEGLWAYQPRKPAVCLRQRYGDCKDKSLLLVGLLRLLEVEAWPLLVSSTGGAHVADLPPSPLSFDHCVVGIGREGGPVYVDPTWSHQGGGFPGRSFPDFGRGLPLRPGADDLVALPTAPAPLIELGTELEVKPGGDEASFVVTTRYHGAAADGQRDGIAGMGHDDLARRYERFYSEVYPGIRRTAPLEVRDEDRFGINVLTVVEHYAVAGIWQPVASDSTRRALVVRPLELEEYLGMVPSPARTAPYHAGPPVDFRFHAVVSFPEPRYVEMEPVRIAGPGYAYESSAYTEGKSVHCEYRYWREVEDVAPAETPAFLAAHARMLEDLGLYVWETSASGFRTHAGAVALACVMLLGGALLAWFVGRRYDPAPAATRVRDGIGGWLVLPAIGIVLAPLGTALTLFSEPNSFDATIWEAAGSGGPGQGLWHILLGAELSASVLLAVWATLVAVLFFRRRSSVPRLYVGFLVVTALFHTLDTLLIGPLAGSGPEVEEVGALARTWFATFIWVPYFLTSARVRETFVIRARPAPATQAEAAMMNWPLPSGRFHP